VASTPAAVLGLTRFRLIGSSTSAATAGAEGLVQHGDHRPRGVPEIAVKAFFAPPQRGSSGRPKGHAESDGFSGRRRIAVLAAGQ